jgi:hypothetical protein
MVSAVLDGIDDAVALFDERPVVVAELMRAVMSSILVAAPGPVVIVHPSWWSRARIDLVVQSSGAARKVVALSRSEVVRAAGHAGTLIEIAGEFVAVAGPGLRVFGRGNIESIAAAAAEVGRSGDVLLDAPAAIPGSAQTAEQLRVALAARGRSARDVDVAALADAMVAALQADRETLLRLGQEGRRRVLVRHDAKLAAELLEGHFAAAIAGH